MRSALSPLMILTVLLYCTVAMLDSDRPRKTSQPFPIPRRTRSQFLDFSSVEPPSRELFSRLVGLSEMVDNLDIATTYSQSVLSEAIPWLCLRRARYCWAATPIVGFIHHLFAIL